MTQALGPSHEIDLNGTATTIRTAAWYVYESTAEFDIRRSGQGYATGSAPGYTYTLINPVSISIWDKQGHIQQQIQATRASTSGKLEPSDMFAQSSYTRWQTYQYTNCCQVQSERAYFEIPATGEGLKSVNYAETGYHYDEMKRRIATISPGGTINRYVYDVRNNVLSYWVGTNDTGATNTDPSGGQANPSWQTLTSEQWGELTAAGWDELLATTANNMVIITSNVYDDGQDGGDGNLTQEAQYADAINLRVTNYTYDFRNRRIEIDGEIDYFEQTIYDNLSRPVFSERYNTSTSGNLVARFETKYDNRGRVYRTIQYGVDAATGQLSGGTLEDDTFYDAAGNVNKMEPIDIEQYQERTYDSLNRMVTTTNSLNATTTFTYEVNGTQLTLTDAEDNTTSWSYDGIGRVVKEANELDYAQTYEYGPAGNLITKIDRNGRLTEYEYDDLGRNTVERWKNGTTTVNAITTTYSVESSVLTAADLASGLAYTYDGRNRPVTASNAGTSGVPTVLLTLTHNRLSQRTSVSATINGAGDFRNGYLYDALGRMERITQIGQTGGSAVADKRVDFEYGSPGYNTGIIRYESSNTANLVASTELSYDVFLRLIGQTHAKGSTTLSSYSVTYDANRRIDSMTVPDGFAEYAYDAAGELLDADYDYQANEGFSYDLTGNRTMTGYSTGPNNQLLSDGTHVYEYDNEGNRVKRTTTASGDYVNYAWDHRNRLTTVTFRSSGDAKTKEIFYAYDVNNRRIRRQVDANGDGTIDSAQGIAYDAGWKPGLEDIVLIFNESESIVHRFLNGSEIDQPLADEQQSGIQWLLPGQLGTIIDVVRYASANDTTTNINHLVYSSYGEIKAETNSGYTPYYTYTAREWDEAAGIYYYRARWYDPVVGVFTSEDPERFINGDVNLYSYVRNSPVIFSDGSGLWPGYGQYCGPRSRFGEKPDDALDAACKEHDACVTWGCVFTPCCIAECDAALCGSAMAMDCSVWYPEPGERRDSCVRWKAVIAFYFCNPGLGMTPLTIPII
ncbi:RHS repeat-associated core domain-containing protein [Rubinisphaera margarita]|uniref:RHS repeat-associated core domain-containing protein n=1 Tax=Rubinisphaera margarita TaxID=2909586 RepID=UPI001EE89287|nr:RHS repeat-associated core domain-containing protein [Rubinisphaera margarita]MCG6154171.1 hypothetical protein [Rubinisphaera margarita]